MSVQELVPSILAGLFGLLGIVIGGYMAHRQNEIRERRSVLEARIDQLITIMSEYQTRVLDGLNASSEQHNRDLGLVARAYAICISVADSELNTIADGVLRAHMASPRMDEQVQKQVTEAMRAAIKRMAQLAGGADESPPDEPL